LIAFLRDKWFFLGLFSSSVLAYFVPEWGVALRQHDIFGAAIFLSFFFTGLSLQTETIASQVRDVKALTVAVVSSLFLYPAIAWALAHSVLPYDVVVGVCIIASGPVTISSGTMLTALAKGNVPLSLLICLLTNGCAVFTMPVLLGFFLDAGTAIHFPVTDMLGGLALKVLLPLMLGQALRPLLRSILSYWLPFLSVFQSCIILLIIFNAVSSSATALSVAGSTLFYTIIFMLVLHGMMLAVNYGIARLLRLNHASTAAVTIHASQKTLSVTYLVWAGYFASNYPMGFIPAIICQLTQMTTDSFVANTFRKKGENGRK